MKKVLKATITVEKDGEVTTRNARDWKKMKERNNKKEVTTGHDNLGGATCGRLQARREERGDKEPRWDTRTGKIGPGYYFDLPGRAAMRPIVEEETEGQEQEAQAEAPEPQDPQPPHKEPNQDVR